jgi:hypothetical protein
MCASHTRCHATWFMIGLLSLLLSVTPVPIIAQQTERPKESPQESAISKTFEEHIKSYLALQKNLESTLPGFKSTNDATEIAAHQRELTAKLVEARKNAHQGDLFTPEVAAQFQEIIRTTFQEPGAQVVRRTIQEGDAPKPIAVKVNAAYPNDSPVQTTPPTLLKRLPALPMELAYRILGRSLVLLDNKTNLIVDFIPDAIP